MKTFSKISFLEEIIDLLVRHYGAARVQAAIKKIAQSSPGPNKMNKPSARNKGPIILQALEQIREREREKYQLLSDFLRRLDDRSILPESQDIRYFAQLLGLKEIKGKSRKEMIGALIRFLLSQPTGRLRSDLAKAESISESERQLGFSVLTDKLLRTR